MDPLNTRQAAVKRRCTAIGGELGQAPSGVVNDQAMRPTPTTGRRRVVDKPESVRAGFDRHPQSRGLHDDYTLTSVRKSVRTVAPVLISYLI